MAASSSYVQLRHPPRRMTAKQVRRDTPDTASKHSMQFSQLHRSSVLAHKHRELIWADSTGLERLHSRLPVILPAGRKAHQPGNLALAMHGVGWRENGTLSLA
ncbi:Hypothetical predicted protein [Pelobates cultripes]|uniref:Uncharacterized protein n=1 Tax=Pelobates cultripes TaxID=61616 RepID=A0AAD1S0X5_PELCU|nr:Hypothetical predicted protein [Pelobates cultripes]